MKRRPSGATGAKLLACCLIPLLWLAALPPLRAATPKPVTAVHTLPAAPPAVTRTAATPSTPHPTAALVLPQYSIGSPTDEEQLWLEEVNYERANPQAESQILESTTDPTVLAAYSFFSVDLSAMVSAFASISPAPPLSMNAELIAAARGHSQDMLTNTYQGHTGSDGSTPQQRIAAQGYDASTYGENVFAFATSVFEGNAAFEVDWGVNPPTGMQDPPGHRENDHDPTFAEVGIGIVDGTVTASGTTFGPILCTMDFGTQTTYTPFVTGVVYYDVLGSGTYAIGDGLGGVTVTLSGASYSAVTANSGGYSIPTSGTGSQTVTFSVSGAADQQVMTTLTGTSNVKVDLQLTYTPPVVSGPTNPPVNVESGYQFTALPGATSYGYKHAELAPFPTVESGANGTGDFTVSTTGTYNVVTTDETFDGAASYHLAHLTPDEQDLTLNYTLLPTATSNLRFESFLGYATTTEVAYAEISTDGGSTWQPVWSQAGTGTAGDNAFQSRSISLSQYAGEEIRLRFAYAATGSSYYNSAMAGVGLYLDNIQVTNATKLTNGVSGTVTSGTTFNFEPTVTGTYVLAVRPEEGSRIFPYGPDDVVVAVPEPPALPAVTTGSATAIGATTATLNGAVTPNRAATTAWFRWGRDTTYGNTTPVVNAGSGSSPSAIHANLSSLAPFTTYHYELTASNTIGSGTGADQSFTTSILFKQFADKYVGLTGTGPLTGILNITLGANGSFTTGGKVGGKNVSVTGHFTPGGTYSKELGNGLELQLELVPQGIGLVTGTITSGTSSVAVTLDPAEKSTTRTAYTLRLPALTGTSLPQGNGYGALTLPAASTAATFTGRLGDGTPFSFGSNVILDGSSGPAVIPVFLPLYNGKGSLEGLLTRETTVNGDLDGSLTWSKPETSGSYFPAAFSTDVDLYGSLYVKPLPGQPVIALTSGTVTFDAGDLTNAPLENTILLTTNNKISVTGTNPDNLKMSINPSNGLFSGSFVPSGKGKATPFEGALFQDGFNFGIGVFKGPTDPGSVSLQ